MAEAGTLHDAFLDELRDTYDAEKQLTKRCRNWPRPRPLTSCGQRSKPTSRRPGNMSTASSACSRAWTRKCVASTATGSRESSKKASRSWRKISTRPPWMPA